MKEKIQPEVGMGGTIQIGSDCYPVTIVDVFPNRKTIIIQNDKSVRTDNNGMSESQEYTYLRNTMAAKEKFTYRKNGYWIRKGSSMSQGSPLFIGHRRRYYDFSF